MDVIRLQNNRKNNFSFSVGFLLVIMLLSILTCIFNSFPFFEALYFFAYQVLLILLPGFLIVAILDMKAISFLEMILLSYVIGYSSNTLIYIVPMSAGITDIKYFFFAYILLVILLLVIIKSLRRNISALFDLSALSKTEGAILFCLVIILFVLKLYSFSLAQNSLFQFGHEQYTKDFLTWVSDVSSCKKSIPPLSIADGESIRYYHYLVAAQIACISKVCGISSINATSVFSYIQPTIMIALASMSVICRVLKHDYIRILTLICLLFPIGLEEKCIVTYQWHIFVMPMGFDIGFAFFLTILLLLIILFQNNTLDFKYCGICIFLVGMTTGLKGPCAVIAFGLITLFCMYFMFKCKEKKQKMRAVQFVMLSGIVLALVYYIMMFGSVSHFNTELFGGKDELITGIADNIEQKALFRVKNVVFAFLSNIKWFFIELVCPAPIMVIIMVFSILRQAIRKNMNYLTFIMFFCYFCSALMTANIKMVGVSEMYFVMTSLCIPAFVSGMELEYIIEKNKINPNFYLLTCFAAFCVLFSVRFGWHRDLYRYSRNSAFEILGEEQNYSDNTKYLTKTRFDTYEWIRDNTKSDALFVLDYSFEHNEFTAISERFAILMEKEVIDSLKSGDSEARKIIEESKANYCIIKMDTSEEWTEAINWETVVVNDELAIYKMK